MKFTRLQACKQIKSQLTTSIVGEQLISYKHLHRFDITLFTLKDSLKGEVIARFHSYHSSRHYNVKVTGKQILHFLRKYYSRA